MALSAGLDLPIINPLDSQLMATIDAFNVLYNYDHDASIYIEQQSNQEAVTKKETTNFSLNEIVLHGLKDEAVNTTKELLKTTPGLEIINNILIPALDMVGKQYEKNIIFNYKQKRLSRQAQNYLHVHTRFCVETVDHYV